MVFYKLGQGARTLVSYRTMRLCNIKLSGFKSFVDPTNLIVPSSLVGIVGPNGCGKSNIIDAVTWVMGESSAKHLRGESLTDVIFSGSSARQPVGMASVELVFDNTENKIKLLFLLKDLFKKDNLSNVFAEFMSKRLKEIDQEDIPESYMKAVQKNIISEEEYKLGKIKFDDKILHRSRVIRFYTEEGTPKQKSQKNLNSIYLSFFTKRSKKIVSNLSGFALNILFYFFCVFKNIKIYFVFFK